jgi:predicted cupin superfamily sugar epimerase
MSRPTAQEMIDAYDLKPLVGEGGYFRQTWIRAGEDPTSPLGTAILYLVTPGSFSALHRLAHDEIFHFYLGDPCEAVAIDPSGNLSVTVLGHDIAAGMQVQHIVPAGSWQGTRLIPGGEWALFGTTMAPGFDISGFELATHADIEQFAPGIADRVRAFIAAVP